jgi:hypothetical protein
MSLVISAYSLENDDDYNSGSTNLIEKKRKALNTTQKRRETFKTRENEQQSKITSSILENMHQSTEEDENEYIGQYSHPKSMTSLKKEEQEKEEQKKKESMVNMSNKDIVFRTLGRAPQPMEDTDKYETNDYGNYGDEKTNEDYYKRILPGYAQQQTNSQERQKNYYNQTNYKTENLYNQDSVLLQKMNYMISLLEDQQDERTDNVTEEVILYSFLGIFIIFISDSFVRAGKYVR